MKLKYTTILLILLFISFAKITYSNTPPNIVKEFVVTDTSMKFDFSPVTYFSLDKLFIMVTTSKKDKIYEYNINGDKLGEDANISLVNYIKNISFANDTLKIDILMPANDTIRHYVYAYTNNLKDYNEFKDRIYYGSYIESEMQLIPRNDSIYALVTSLNKLDMTIRHYRYIVMDSNYTIARTIDLETDSIDPDIASGFLPSYILDNGHHLFTLKKMINGNPFKKDSYFYEFDFDGKYYSKKLQDNKIVYNGDTLINEPKVSTKKDFGEEVVSSELSKGKTKFKVLIKYARNGDILWIKPLDDYPNILPDRVRIKYLFNKQIIAIAGRYYKDGIYTNPFGSFLELYDNDGNKLESYFWHRNPSLDCTVLGVNEGPNNHIYLFTKNGSDSLVVSEMVPKYLGVKDNIFTKSNIKAFPNPASSKTTIKLTEDLNGKITAVDLLGNEIPLWSGFAPAGDLELDVSHLPVGIYTILINNGYKTEALKMIKE